NEARELFHSSWTSSAWGIPNLRWLVAVALPGAQVQARRLAVALPGVQVQARRLAVALPGVQVQARRLAVALLRFGFRTRCARRAEKLAAGWRRCSKGNSQRE